VRNAVWIALVVVTLAGCRSDSSPQPPLPRYVVTSNPIDVGPGILLCVAIDPADPHGVWWWQPGASGCASRSTGPEVFHANQAAVSRLTRSEVTTVAFCLQTHSATATRSFVDVRLLVEDNEMRALESGARVALTRRNDLDIPDIPGGPSPAR
jgi:hypothetical protein